MKTPVHNFKQLVKPEKDKPFWYCDSRHGWLGSGLFDRNGREIYEGDRVKIYPIVQLCNPPAYFHATVIFDKGAFTLDKNELLSEIPSSHIEIIGHVTEGLKNEAT